jgi:DNA-binding MarR family transcriptional regulator
VVNVYFDNSTLGEIIMNAERAKLHSLIRALKRFNQFDTKMQVSTMLTLLEIAAANEDRKDISVQDLERSIGLLSGTASRNVYYWADGGKDMTGAHQMVTIRMNPEDRRRRELVLNAKGKAFLDTVLGEINGSTAREEVPS